MAGWRRQETLLAVALVTCASVVCTQGEPVNGTAPNGNAEPANATGSGNNATDAGSDPPNLVIEQQGPVLQTIPPRSDTRLVPCGHSPGVLRMSVVDAWDTGAVLDFRVLNLPSGQTVGTKVRMVLPDDCKRKEGSGYNIQITEKDGQYFEIETTIRQHGWGLTIEKQRYKDPRDCFPDFVGIDEVHCNDCAEAGVYSTVRAGELWESRFGMTTKIGGIDKVPAGTSVTFELPENCAFSDGWNAQYSTNGQWVHAILDYEDAQLDMIIDMPWKSDPIMCFPYQATVHC
mmetsp:Transcript_31876/g.78010  ORF Transcript_31876/g.78010 Transcript_31876/m.78010 type:complete len:288 (+) Transcript_31876:127-990(+)